MKFFTPKPLMIVTVGAVLIVLVGFQAKRYLAVGLEDQFTKQPFVDVIPSESAPERATVPFRAESVVTGLEVPWSIVFTSSDSDERMLVSERKGTIRQVVNGRLVGESLVSFPEVSSSGEEGLMGLALDPEYQTNKFFYASLAYPKQGDLVVKVVKLQDLTDSASIISTIIDDLPAAQFHAGSRIKFGPDKKLYITTGDATDKQIAQDLDSLGGKILRLNADGSVPEDNPFPNSPIYSLGHRNPQGIDWHPVSGQLVATEHGPSLFDGPAGGDEINSINPGDNYGWPIVSHEQSRSGLVDPVLVFTPAVAPGSGMFYSGSVFPQFTNNYFFGALKGETIVRVTLNDDRPHRVVSFEKLTLPDVGRVREVTQSPEGFIYFSTSNRDGRGKIRTGDDKIYRLLPLQ